jgi:hypothetical protein
MSAAFAHELEVALRARDHKAVLTPESADGADDHAVSVDGALASGSVAQIRQRWASAVPSRPHYGFGTFAHFCNAAPSRGLQISVADFNSVTTLTRIFRFRTDSVVALTPAAAVNVRGPDER